MPDEFEPQQRLFLDRLQEEYSRRYGAAVELIKANVGAGIEYANSAGRVVISENGAWFECFDLPMEFSGAVGGPVTYRSASDGEALNVLNAIVDRLAAPGAFPNPSGIFVLYSRRGLLDERETYVFQGKGYDHSLDRNSISIGQFRPDTLPLLFRARIDCTEGVPGLTLKRGVACCLSGVGDGNLIVEISYEADNLTDLSAALHTELIQ